MKPPPNPLHLGRRSFAQGTASGALSMAITACSAAPEGAVLDDASTDDGEDSGPGDDSGVDSSGSDSRADSTTDASDDSGATGDQPGAPVWSTVPAISFVEGVPSENSVAANVSDPDGDALTVMLNDVELPTGVSFDPDGVRFDYDGSGLAATTTDHVLTADDGMASTASNPFDIMVRPPPMGPAWVEDLPLLEWTVLPNENFAEDVQAPDTGQYGNTGPRSVLAAWCGGAYCPLFGDSGAMVHWGGGHQDYYGNEVYAFDLATLTWQRLDDPSPGGYDGPWPEGLRADGRPASIHSMFRIGCRTATGELYTSVRETDNFGGGQTLRVSRYDLATNTWLNGTGEGGHAPTLGYGGTYDRNRDGVWTHHANNGQRWSFYDFAADTWDDYQTGGPAAGGGDLAYCPTHDMVLNHNGLGSGFWGLDPTAPAEPSIELTQSGTPPTLDNTATVQWSDNLDAYVVYPSGGDALYLLRAPDGDWRTEAWQWEALAVTGSTGEHPYSGVTSDKLRVIEWGATTIVLLNASWDGPAVACLLT